MKRYKGKEVEVRVETFSLDNYCIYYREKKRFNLFNPWKTYCYTWSLGWKGSSFDPHQPHLFDKYEWALAEAKRLKSKPELIDENNEKRWKKYDKLHREFNEYRKERNRSITL
jgi:hypothetical protein